MRKLQPIWEVCRRMGILLLIGLGIALLYSVIRSGYFYQFDVDELLNSQLAYLYHTGYRPYLDIYTFVYPPVFQWITIPAFLIKGFTFEGIYAARVIMITLYLIRLSATFVLIDKIFNQRTALFFIPLLLFDPLAVFNSIQYRSDNLMMTLLALGLATLAVCITKPSVPIITLTGFFLGFSVLVLTKILPTVACVVIGFCIYALVKHKPRWILHLGLGLIIMPLLFLLYLVTQGSVSEMIQQMFFDLKSNYSNFAYPIPIYALFKPDNIYIFGTMGKPITWVYLLLITPLGLMGAFHAGYRLLTDTTHTQRDVVKLILLAAVPLQWAPLFVVPVAFSQHYLPVHWLFAMFTAYALNDLLTASKKYRFVHIGIVTFLIISYVHISLTSIYLNNERSTIRGKEGIQSIENRWKQIPENEPIFPGFLFRPQAYPIAYGSFITNFPDSILKRLPDMATILATKKPKILLDEYTLVRLPDAAQQYINAHYERVAGDKEMMEWKK